MLPKMDIISSSTMSILDITDAWNATDEWNVTNFLSNATNHVLNATNVVNSATHNMFNVTNLVNSATNTELSATNLWNATNDAWNATNVLSATNVSHRTMGPMFGILVKVVYLVGILGNAAAIISLRTGERRMRNRKHLLLLTTLAANDLVALVGMMGALLVSELVPGASHSRWYCAARIVLRSFGIGSVCIAVTMALERYLALTRPFVYQKQVTFYVIRSALLISWGWAAVLTCAPVAGLGVYYEETASGGRCVRYRNAVTSTDIGYAAFYVFFGLALCVVLVYCNLAVIRALYAITAPRAPGAPLVRRLSKTSCRQRQRSQKESSPHHNAATAEEVAFSRLMATLSVCFMICWLPQMITSALYLALGSDYWARLSPLGVVSDVLMLLNYVLDPLLYVLLRRRPLAAVARLLALCFKRSHKSSSESVSLKTACCPDTVVVSDSAELKPLRALPPDATIRDAPQSLL